LNSPLPTFTESQQLTVLYPDTFYNPIQPGGGDVVAIATLFLQAVSQNFGKYFDCAFIPFCYLLANFYGFQGFGRS